MWENLLYTNQKYTIISVQKVCYCYSLRLKKATTIQVVTKLILTVYQVVHRIWLCIIYLHLICRTKKWSIL